jgi:hypothetical protein
MPPRVSGYTLLALKKTISSINVLHRVVPLAPMGCVKSILLESPRRRLLKRGRWLPVRRTVLRAGILCTTSCVLV